MRILFTCVGRRVELIQAFRKAAEELRIELLIYGADVSTTAPALFFCDRRIQAPPIKSIGYISGLINLCKEQKINALIPTIDTDLCLLAQNKQAFAAVGTQVMISDVDVVNMCRDKRLVYDYFIRCNLISPTTVDNVEQYVDGFPCFIKPIDGSSSIDAFKVDNQEDLEVYAHKLVAYIIQPYIKGTEYTVDVFCDFNGNPIYITPRERLVVRGGEVIKTKITQDEQIIEECRRLVKKLRPCGAITVQLIRQADSRKDFFIEVNPRFGGGAPLSIKAGADSALVMLRLLSGEAVAYQPKAARDGAVYSRFDQSVDVASGYSEFVSAIIFDLDDTLYAERDYVWSGYREVAKTLPQIPDALDILWTAFREGKPAIDTLLESAGIYAEELKRKCLETYRKHEPVIEAYGGIREMLIELRQKNVKIGILTDGRPEGQRAKISALGLNELVDEIVVTDELGGEMFRKPNDIAFRVMQRRLGVPFNQMLYVGDNLKKDFTAPTKLGMRFVYFNNPDGLYSNANEQGNQIYESMLCEKVASKDDLIKCISEIVEKRTKQCI